jgi:hypothetical protein
MPSDLGSATPSGVPPCLLAIGLLLGREDAWLPEDVRERTIAGHRLVAAIDPGAATAALAGTAASAAPLLLTSISYAGKEGERGVATELNDIFARTMMENSEMLANQAGRFLIRMGSVAVGTNV